MNRFALAIALATMFLTAAPEPARCTYCPSFTCYDSGACNGCVCIQSQPWRGGQCVYIAPHARSEEP